MTSREEFDRRLFSRIFLALGWIAAFAFTTGGFMEDGGFGLRANAQEVAAQESESEKGASDKEEDDAPEANDQGTEKEETAKSDKEEDPPGEKHEEDEPVSENEREEAENTAGEAGSEKEAADKEEDLKAAAEEAAGAEVEIDESPDEEEEPQGTQNVADKTPPAQESKPEATAPPATKRVIGATATIMEKQSELLFKARVDSGAKSCSLHIEDYKIENEADQMADNIGKVITFHIKNGNNESHWLEAKIAGYVIVKNASHRERRYKVPLTLRYKDFEKTVLVTLNNREKMEFPLLLGRNFLMNDFLVDVSVENGEQHLPAL